jgi:hypothetical protein
MRGSLAPMGLIIDSATPLPGEHAMQASVECSFEKYPALHKMHERSLSFVPWTPAPSWHRIPVARSANMPCPDEASFCYLHHIGMKRNISKRINNQHVPATIIVLGDP